MASINLKKQIILLAVLFMQVAIIQAQDDYQTQMDNVFNIPAYKVTTGVLINRSPDIIEMQNLKLQTTINDEMENDIRVFPNSVENILNLQIFNCIEGEVRITVVNINGQSIYSQPITNNESNTIDCSGFVGGIYIVTIVFKDNTRTFKIIKK
jgi:hypothetical protein